MEALLAQGAQFNAAATVALIDCYQPVDPVAAYYKAQTLQLIGSTPCFANRYWYEPGHLTAQAIVIRPDDRSVAMMRHKELGIDLFFGGHREPQDSDLIATALREAKEEGGIGELRLIGDAPFDIDIHGFPARGDQPDHLHFDIRFLFEANAGAVITANEESDATFWVPVRDLRTRLASRSYASMWMSDSRIVKQLEERYG